MLDTLITLFQSIFHEYKNDKKHAAYEQSKKVDVLRNSMYLSLKTDLFNVSKKLSEHDFEEAFILIKNIQIQLQDAFYQIAPIVYNCQGGSIEKIKHQLSLLNYKISLIEGNLGYAYYYYDANIIKLLESLFQESMTYIVNVRYLLYEFNCDAYIFLIQTSPLIDY